MKRQQEVAASQANKISKDIEDLERMKLKIQEKMIGNCNYIQKIRVPQSIL